MAVAPSRTRGWLIGFIGIALLVAAGIGVARVWRLPARPLAQGWAAYQEGRWRDALRLANQRLKDDRSDREALRLLARASARLQLDQVTADFYVRLGQENAQAEDLFLLGDGLMRQAQYAKGEEMWQKALKADPAHAETLSELSRRLARLDRLAEAALLIERLGTLPGWEARAAARLGLIKLAQADPASAIDELRRALRVDSEVHEAGITPRAPPNAPGACSASTSPAPRSRGRATGD